MLLETVFNNKRRFSLALGGVVLALAVSFSPISPAGFSPGLFGLKSVMAETATTSPCPTPDTCKDLLNPTAAQVLRCQLELAACESGLPTNNIKQDSKVGDVQSQINIIIGKLLNPLLALLGALFMVLTIYAGYLWMSAAGNEEKTKKASEIVKWAVIGLIAVASSYVLVNFVITAIISGVG